MDISVLTLSADPLDSIIVASSGMGGATIQIQGAAAVVWWTSNQTIAPVAGINLSAGAILHLSGAALRSFRATGVGATIVVVPDGELSEGGPVTIF